MRFAIEGPDGVDLLHGNTPLLDRAIEPVPNWDDIIFVPFYYLKVVGNQILEMTQEEKDAYDEMHPPTLEELQEAAQLFLDDTDWYVVRLSDPSSGVIVPQDILDARGEAREIL